MKHTFNLANWTGKNATINVRKDGSFNFQGSRVTLEAQPVDPKQQLVPGLTILDIKTDGRKVGTLAKWDDAPRYYATSDFAEGLERSDEVAHVAAAKLLANI